MREFRIKFYIIINYPHLSTQGTISKFICRPNNRSIWSYTIDFNSIPLNNCSSSSFSIMNNRFSITYSFYSSFSLRNNHSLVCITSLNNIILDLKLKTNIFFLKTRDNSIRLWRTRFLWIFISRKILNRIPTNLENCTTSTMQITIIIITCESYCLIKLIIIFNIIRILNFYSTHLSFWTITVIRFLFNNRSSIINTHAICRILNNSITTDNYSIHCKTTIIHL